MKKSISQIAMEIVDNETIYLMQMNSEGCENDSICIDYDLIDIIINWLQEAKKEIEELKKE